MTKSDNLEDAVLAAILQNSTNSILGLGAANLLAAGSGAGSTNLYLQLHTNGVAETVSNLNEVTSETGYANYSNLATPVVRNTGNWSNLSAGLFANGNTSNFTFPQVNDSTNPVVTHWSITSSNGNILYSGPLSDSDPQPFVSEDNQVTNALTVIAHGHASGDEIILIALPNVTFPSGVSSNTVVYVSLSNTSEDALPETQDFLRVALTAGGDIIDIGSGAGLIAGMNSQTLANGNTPRFVTNALRITED